MSNGSELPVTHVDFAPPQEARRPSQPPYDPTGSIAGLLQVPGANNANPAGNNKEPTPGSSGTPSPSRPGSTRASSINAANAATQVRYDDPDFAHPPTLNYTLRSRKKSIFWFWSLIILDCVCMPIALYFGLWYGTSLSHNAVFSISTGLLGTVSIVEYFIRFHRLWKKGSTCRVIGAKRFYLDWFHWNLSTAWIAVMIELIVGTVPEEPPIRLLAMPVPSMVFAFGVEMLVMDIARIAGYRAPMRISSLPKGSPLRPGIYSIIEDICAVDGSGGTEFRQRLNLRYMASHHFRLMLHRLTLFWAFGACAVAALTTALIFTMQRDAAYVIGWVVPFLWAGIWAGITLIWVQKSLKFEYENWEEVKWKA
ncbi:uncharacterized protein BKCO1_3600027 [Diplodia corticola]|uniref:Uncharacterized protein n=1 Tax=Diplodia corticola TaxID=236234 RepID=A0A1J9RWL7_9PEZI|nr:uncharacterized protein BKCO1_3600027 [Diplodia corticola]OJD32767.1 hypothetical protein BKCO1_3600027 [Diplodia corticola]